ncbi:MAG: 5-nucleotidase [Segetibacter sp.]|nr:5-nucleotidase [Segetibacter sp.]
MTNRRKFLVHTTLAAGAMVTKPLKSLALNSVPASSSINKLSIIDLSTVSDFHHTLHKVSNITLASKSASLIFATTGIPSNNTGGKEQLYQLKQAGCDVLLDKTIDGEKENHEYLSRTSAILPFTILNKGDIKIGVISEGVSLKDPVTSINETAAYLKKFHSCNLIVVVHPEQDINANAANKYFDREFVAFTKDVDVIISRNNPVDRLRTYVVRNSERNEVIIINQGKETSITKAIDISFNNKKEKVRMAISPVLS